MGHPLQLRLADGVDLLKKRGQGDAGAEGQHLAPDVVGDVGGPVQAKQGLNLQLVLGAHELLIADRLGDADDLPHREEGGVVQVVAIRLAWLADQVEAQQPGIAVRGPEGGDAVDGVVLVELPQLEHPVVGVIEVRNDVAGEAAVRRLALVPAVVPQQLLDDAQLEGVGVARTTGSPGHGHVGQGDQLVGFALLPTHEAGRAGCLGHRVGQAAEVLRRQVAQLALVHGPRADKDHTGARVVGRDKVVDQLLVDPLLNVLWGAQDGQSVARPLEGPRVKVVHQNLVNARLDVLLLLQDGATLGLHVGLGAAGVQEDVRQDVHGLRDVLLEALHVVAGVLPRGVGIEVGAHLLHAILDVPPRTLPRTLEVHVLQKVSNTVVLQSLVPASGINPNTHRAGFPGLHLGGNPKPIVQLVLESGRNTFQRLVNRWAGVGNDGGERRCSHYLRL
eukprot:RCo039560